MKESHLTKRQQVLKPDQHIDQVCLTLSLLPTGGMGIKMLLQWAAERKYVGVIKLPGRLTMSLVLAIFQN